MMMMEMNVVGVSKTNTTNQGENMKSFHVVLSVFGLVFIGLTIALSFISLCISYRTLEKGCGKEGCEMREINHDTNLARMEKVMEELRGIEREEGR